MRQPASKDCLSRSEGLPVNNCEGYDAELSMLFDKPLTIYNAE